MAFDKNWDFVVVSCGQTGYLGKLDALAIQELGGFQRLSMSCFNYYVPSLIQAVTVGNFHQ